MRCTIERPRPNPRATLAPSSSRWNSRKITFFFDAGMPSPVSYTSMRRLPPRCRQPTRTRPFGVYLIALETRFCNSRRSRRRSERMVSEQGTYRRSRPFSRASGENSTSSWRSISSMRKLTNSGRIAPVSSREMSSSAPKISSTASSEASTLPIRRAFSVLAAALALPLLQRGHVEARGIERLQDVVAGGGEETGLGDIGLLGVGLGAAELGIEPRQLGGALAHAHFQRRVGALQRLGRDHARRDVGRGGDDAAVGHAVRSHLDDEAAVDEALEKGFAVRDIVRQPLADERHRPGRGRARPARRCGGRFPRA